MELAEGKRKAEDEPSGSSGMRRIIIRAAALAVVLAAAVLLYTTGKAHILISDNKAVTVEGREIEPLVFARVKLKGEQPLELMPRDRDKADVKGTRITVTVEKLSKQGEVLETRKLRLRLGSSEMYLLSLPAAFSGSEEYLTVLRIPAPETVFQQGFLIFLLLTADYKSPYDNNMR